MEFHYRIQIVFGLTTPATRLVCYRLNWICLSVRYFLVYFWAESIASTIIHFLSVARISMSVVIRSSTNQMCYLENILSFPFCSRHCFPCHFHSIFSGWEPFFRFCFGLILCHFCAIPTTNLTFSFFSKLVDQNRNISSASDTDLQQLFIFRYQLFDS